MPDTVFLDFPNMESLPTARQIAEMAGSRPSLILRFPTRFEIVSANPLTTRDLAEGFLKSLVEELIPLLPDHSVFDAGGIYDEEARKNLLQQPIGATISGVSRLRLLRVISEESVLSHAEAFLLAAQRFRRTATDLASRLALRLTVSLEAFGNQEFELECDGSCNDAASDLDSEWTYWFHGDECLFSNTKTGEYVEVILGFGDEFGVLDPYFFTKYLQSVPEFQSLAQLFTHEYHDTQRAFEILERHGRLQRVKGMASERTGLVATSHEGVFVILSS